MSGIQKWLSGLIGLGALYLVVTNPNGTYKVLTGLQRVTAGSIVNITTGGRR
jgi:hypothetical protein